MSKRWHITLLAAGGATALESWVDEPGREDGRVSYELPTWQRCTERLVHRARQDLGGGEVAVSALGYDLPTIWDRDQLRQVLQRARSSCWGAPVYLVVSREIHANESLEEQRISVMNWLGTVRTERAADILQLPYDPVVEEPPKVSDLRSAIDESQLRQELLFSLAHGEWGCALSDGRPSARELLGPLSVVPGRPSRLDHVLLVVDGVGAHEQTTFVRRKLLEFPRGEHLVAVLGTPSAALQRLCADSGLPEPLAFRGELELWSFLLRLNARRPTTSLEPEEGPARAVPRDAVPTFERGGEGRPSMLVTSAFDPGWDKAGQMVEAARDVGMLVGILPDPTRCRVHPRVDPEVMIRLVRQLRPPAVWVHLGHGRGPEGLEDAERRPVAPRRWLSCFGGWKGSLPLVVLLACRSAETAELFARAGAGVAVGFEGDILSREARLLAEPVVKAALSMHGDRGTILEEFDAGRRHLDAVESRSRPVSFYGEP